MFGQNPIRKIDYVPADGLLAVQDIFYTIQGEGPFTGEPAVFIRLAGCHLACTFCDTDFESNVNQRLTVEAIRGQATVAALAVSESLPLVVITGGEPMRQNIAPLIYSLLAQGFKHVQIETAGNLWPPGFEDVAVGLVDERVTLVCSPKTPHLHHQILKYCSHWKYVVSASTIGGDGLPCTGTQANLSAAPFWVSPGFVKGSGGTIWLSPMDEQDPEKNAANLRVTVDACMKHGFRLSLQTHKIIGMP